jgi:sugar O-acyltransferase (sialic acid O-acetyltransferase NeuD family)
MKKVVIFGVGDLAQVACVYLRKDSPYQIAAFTVHQQYLPAGKVLGLDAVPFENLEASHPPSGFRMFVAVGYKRLNRARQEIYDTCKAKGYELISYVNSRACCWGEVEMGDNCFVFEQNVIQPFVKIGNNVILWSGNHVGHHARIDDHCFIASHAVISGRVHLGAHTFVGVNATFKDGVRVAPGCVIGAGAAIMRDTQADEVYVPEYTRASRVKAGQLTSFR